MSRVAGFFAVLTRIALGGIFIYASLSKIVDPVAFAGSVAAYQIVPYFASYLTAATLPFLELVCGVLLVCGCRVKAAAFLVAAMNLVFIGALAWAIARGLDIDCGCFKQGGPKSTPWIPLIRDLVFLAMAVFVLRFENGKASPRRT